jgi:tRNA A37 methylthiotransferase MiaB
MEWSLRSLKRNGFCPKTSASKHRKSPTNPILERRAQIQAISNPHCTAAQKMLSPIQSETKQKNEVKRVYVDSLDYCEEARLDTQRLISLFKVSSQQSNLEETKDPHQADFLIYNACGHLQRTQDASIREIKELLKLRKNSAQLIVWGCLPKINPASLREVYDGPMIGPEESWDFFRRYFNLLEKEEIDVYANTLNNGYVHVPKVRDQLTQRQGLGSIYRCLQVQRERIFNFGNRKTMENTWYIKIVSGCRNSCTYCSDRLAYKSLRSHPIEKIIEQFELGLHKGYRNFFFVGRDLGSYGYDLGITLPDLLDAIIVKYHKFDFKLFLTQISPNSLIDMYPKLERLLAARKIFYLGSHIQSGSSRILKLMGKNFPLSKWVEVIRDIKKNHPEILLETTIMVGFPSETDQDFEKSVNLLSSLPFDSIGLYEYNERPNLPSLRIKNRIPEEIKNTRYYRMLNYVTVFEARERITPAKIFSATGLNSWSNLTLVRLYRLLRSCLG